MSKNDISVRNYSVTTINDIENNLTVLHKEADLSVGHALNAQLCVINVVKSPLLYSSAIDLFFEHMKSGMSLCRNDAEIKECRQRYCLMLNNMLFFTRAKIEFEVKANRELGRTLMLQAIDQLSDSIVDVVSLCASGRMMNKKEISDILLNNFLKDKNDNILKKAWRWFTEKRRLTEELRKFHNNANRLINKIWKHRKLIGKSDIIAGLIDNYADEMVGFVMDGEISYYENKRDSAFDDMTDSDYMTDWIVFPLVGALGIQIVVLVVRWIISWFSDYPENWATTQWIWCGIIVGGYLACFVGWRSLKYIYAHMMMRRKQKEKKELYNHYQELSEFFSE